MSALAVPYPRAIELVPRIRQSTLAGFDACALSQFWSLEHEQGWSTSDQLRGHLVHRTLARCLKLMKDEGEPRISVDQAMRIFEEQLRHQETPPLADVAQARVDVICWANGTEWSVDEIAAIEDRLETRITYPDGNGGLVERVFTGQPDALLIDPSGTHAIVPDWKSTWAVPPEKHSDPLAVHTEGEDEQISDEGYFQQRAYALLVFHNLPGVERVTLREYYPRYATSTKTKPTREASIHRYRLAEIEMEFSALAERFDRAVELGEWRPSPGSHCVNCLMPWKCPILPEARREGMISTQRDAERVAGWINVAEAALSRYRKMLRPWTNRHGAVRIKDAKRERFFGPVLRRRVDRPSREEMDWALANGIDPRSLYREREVPTFEAFNAEDLPPQARQMADTERMLLAAEKRAAARRRRKNGG